MALDALEPRRWGEFVESYLGRQLGRWLIRIALVATFLSVIIGAMVFINMLAIEHFSKVSWTATGAMLSGIGGVLTAVAIGGASLAAWRTYKDWKERELFIANRQLAVDILEAFYEGRAAISEVRRPIPKGELDKKDKPFGVTEKMKMSEIIQNRIKDREEVWQKVLRLTPRAQAIFGADVKKLMFKIMDIRREIRVDAKRYPNADELEKRQFESMLAKGRHDHTDYYVPDPINNRLNDAEAALEEILNPHITG